MPFDETPSGGGGSGHGRDILRELAMATMDAFDNKIDEMKLCDGCATRALVQEAMMSLLMIGHVHNVSPQVVGEIINGHFREAYAMVEDMKMRGIL